MLELWTEAVRSIEPKVKPAHRDRWLRPIECIAISSGRIRLRAPNRYHKEWFEDNFLPSILEDLESRASRSFKVDFEIEETVMGVVVDTDRLPGGEATASADRTPDRSPERATPTASVSTTTRVNLPP